MHGEGKGLISLMLPLPLAASFLAYMACLCAVCVPQLRSFLDPAGIQLPDLCPVVCKSRRRSVRYNSTISSLEGVEEGHLPQLVPFGEERGWVYLQRLVLAHSLRRRYWEIVRKAE